MALKYFTLSEFDSPDKPGSGSMMNDMFLNQLDDARGIAGTPFIITSGFRTPEHNAHVGGVGGASGSVDSSAHTRGYAVDIACRDSRSRWLILNALTLVGFNRIGIADTFIHVDSDPAKPENVIWTY